MENLAVSFAVNGGSSQFMAMPDMKASHPGEEVYCDSSYLRNVQGGWYPSGEDCSFAHSGYYDSAAGQDCYGSYDYQGAEEPSAEAEGRRPRRRGGRRRKAKTSSQSLASSASTPTSGAGSAPVKVGLQAYSRSQSDFAQAPATADTEAIAEVLREAETEEGKSAIMADLASEDKRPETLQWMIDATYALATQKLGCLIVQEALRVADADFRSQLLYHLAPRAVELYESPHGNFCLSKAVEILPAQKLSAIMVKLQERGFEEVSKHKFGCRLMERLIEHVTEADQWKVIEAIAPRAESLSKHQYGNFVVQHLYEQTPASRDLILKNILGQVPQLALHRTASHVVQRALTYSDPRGQRDLVQALLNGREEASLIQVAQGRYGSFVIEQLSQLPSHLTCDVRDRLSADLPSLASSPFGRRVAEAFELELPEEYRQAESDLPTTSATSEN